MAISQRFEMPRDSVLKVSSLFEIVPLDDRLKQTNNFSTIVDIHDLGSRPLGQSRHRHDFTRHCYQKTRACRYTHFSYSNGKTRRLSNFCGIIA
jgi:hypothetical protein